jgi:hypothetical protein
MQVAIAEGKISGEQFNKSVEVTPRNFYEKLFADLSQARTELSKFEGVNVRLDRISAEIVRLGEPDRISVEWDQQKPKKENIA